MAKSITIEAVEGMGHGLDILCLDFKCTCYGRFFPNGMKISGGFNLCEAHSGPDEVTPQLFSQLKLMRIGVIPGVKPTPHVHTEEDTLTKNSD